MPLILRLSISAHSAAYEQDGDKHPQKFLLHRYVQFLCRQRYSIPSRYPNDWSKKCTDEQNNLSIRGVCKRIVFRFDIHFLDKSHKTP